ncbi:MFS transporter [Siminovitchia sp. 179-K 8D1 HS]|uniref:MFS transporter n=1 Tax=Siminovitchia sp. 179-K 8D1 HS TaxID=3142385 RepID=UPI0039A10585
MMLHKADYSNDFKIKSYIDSPDKQMHLYRRTLTIIVISQIFGGAGLAAGITVGALLAQEMLGSNSFAGVPVALFTFGSAGSAFLVGRASQRFGRRFGLAGGFLAGALGAAGVVAAAVVNSVFLLFTSLLIYGAGTATNLQARYAGTDLASPTQRATAVSIAMVATTFGAVAGPNLVDVMGEFAVTIGIPALAGPFILAAAAYFLAGLILLVLLRPDPLFVAKAITNEQTGEDQIKEQDPEKTNTRGVATGFSIMVLSQFVMVAIMTMTPVHMENHGHDLGKVGLVIGIHVGAMYLPSLVTGILVDKIGRGTMAIASGVTLLIAGALPVFAPSDSMTTLMISLTLLGLGWNFGLISGTALIVDSTSLSTRAKTQGAVDVFIALSGALGGVLSGIIAAQTSYTTLAVAGGMISLLIIPVVIWSRSSFAGS